MWSSSKLQTCVTFIHANVTIALRSILSIVRGDRTKSDEPSKEKKKESFFFIYVSIRPLAIVVHLLRF